MSHEITLYLIHGWLHLYGFNDKTETEIKAMRLAEDEAFKLVNEPSGRAISKVHRDAY